jgi:hypothetical protein
MDVWGVSWVSPLFARTAFGRKAKPANMKIRNNPFATKLTHAKA